MINEFKPILKNTNFVYLWSSQILSQLTINIMNFLLLIRLFSITGSSIATSLLWVAYALPSIFLGPIGAASVDFVSKRKMLMLTNLFQALSIFGYAFLHRTNVFLLYGVVISYSALNQFYMPAESASVPAIVKKDYLPFANSLFFLTQQFVMILGFGIAGILNSLLGFTTTLYLCAAFIFLAFISVSLLPELKSKGELSKDLEGAIRDFFESIIDGYQFIKEKRQVWIPFSLLAVIQIILAIIIVNVPAIASSVFRISLNFAGIAIVVPVAVGAIVTSFVVPKLLKSGVRKKKLIEYSLGLAAFCIYSLLLLFPTMSVSLRTFSGIVLVFIAGASFVGMTIPTQTFLQESTPQQLRGRVFGNFWFLVTILTIFPVLFSGTIVEILGIKTLLFLVASLVLGILIYSIKVGDNFLKQE